MKKILWLIVGCLAVAALVLASCAPAVVEEEEEEAGPEMMTVTLTKLDGTKVTKSVEKPEYGGTITTSPVGVAGSEVWDPRMPGKWMEWIAQFNIYQPLLQAQWARGMAGTEEFDYSYTYLGDRCFGPMLAESWERPDVTTFIFHLRQGIHFQDKAPANGREVTAEDAALSVQGLAKTTAFCNLHFPPDKVYATDKYTLVLEVAKPVYSAVQQSVYQWFVFPPEIVGEDDRVEWQNTCGSGAYILDDYISATSATLVKNPNYWGYDPIRPENKLPYADELRYLYIADQATQAAALRTGKVDKLMGLGRETAESLIETNPELQYKELVPSGPAHVFLRADKPPTDDIRVRRALAMAVDRQTMRSDYFNGLAAPFPASPMVEEKTGIWTPLEELSEELRELYEYNPEKAKQLLAEAGYPNGFKVDLLVDNNQLYWADEAVMVKAYWEKIGVIADLRMLTSAPYHSECLARKFDICFYGAPGPDIILFKTHWTPGQSGNMYWGVDENNNSTYRDEETVRRQDEIVYCTDPLKVIQLMKELNLYLMGKVYDIEMPAPFTYNLWQPWLKGYNGERGLSESQSGEGYLHYLWVDQDLKQAMTGKR